MFLNLVSYPCSKRIYNIVFGPCLLLYLESVVPKRCFSVEHKNCAKPKSIQNCDNWCSISVGDIK